MKDFGRWFSEQAAAPAPAAPQAQIHIDFGGDRSLPAHMVLTETETTRLRRLRLWHWRRHLLLLAMKNQGNTDPKLVWEVDNHLLMVSMLNKFFKPTDSVMSDDAVTPTTECNHKHPPPMCHCPNCWIEP